MLLLLQEGEQADTSEQGQKAPKNPLTGQPLTPVTNKDKEGYQATVLAGQSEDTSARIMGQLGGQDGRPFGGESYNKLCARDCLCQARHAAPGAAAVQPVHDAIAVHAVVSLRLVAAPEQPCGAD
jgi:hypothetical protein